MGCVRRCIDVWDIIVLRACVGLVNESVHCLCGSCEYVSACAIRITSAGM